MWFKVFSIMGAIAQIAANWEVKAYGKMIRPAFELLKIIKPKNVKMDQAKLMALAIKAEAALRDGYITHDEVVALCDALGVEYKIKV